MKRQEKKHIVSFSGGKDSTTMLLMLLKRGYRVDEIVFFDGGWEFPQTIKHIKEVEERIKRPITIIRPEKGFDYFLSEHRIIETTDGKEKIKRIGRGWPFKSLRWCTKCKTENLIKGRSSAVWYIGIAKDEVGRRMFNIPPNQKRRYPLMEWGITERQCLKYCYYKGFDFGGLYNHFSRISCFCCPFKRKLELKKLRKYYPDLWQTLLDKDKSIPKNTGFWGGVTAVDLDRRFADEDKRRNPNGV